MSAPCSCISRFVNYIFLKLRSRSSRMAGQILLVNNLSEPYSVKILQLDSEPDIRVKKNLRTSTLTQPILIFNLDSSVKQINSL